MALVKLYADAQPMIVHHLRAVLDEAGIKAAVMGDILGHARGDLPMTVETLAAVWIDEADLPRARPIVEAFMAGGDDAGEPWDCPACGERIEGQFGACWHCGGERPGVETD